MVRSLAMMRAAPLLLAATLALSACVTHRVEPTLSRAVIDARARKDVPTAASVCGPLSSPASVGFGFGEAALSDLATPAVEQAAQQLACHPQIGAIVAGRGDGHGTAQEQLKLAGDRANAVAAALKARGVAAGRISLDISADAKPPAGDAAHLVVMAEGRRW
jgi:outer membrane protein OmpA-like peptidoglycan-associated protein